jgi:hypothetical protein
LRTARFPPPAGLESGSVTGTFPRGSEMETKPNGRKREPSRLALQLADAFAPCAQWSEVRVHRGARGRRTRVIVADAAATAGGSGTAPFDWSAEAL